MFITSIEQKVISVLTKATITDVDLYPVMGIDDILLDWEDFNDYPRIVLAGEEIEQTSQTIGGGATKEYIVNIFILCNNTNKDDCVLIRDTVHERVEAALRKNQRLDNLADNTNTERVFGSEIGRTRLSKSGMGGNYHSVAWIQFKVFTDRKIPN
jgi:hypothetical protein